MFKLSVSFALLIAILLSLLAWGGENRWTPSGPSGGSVRGFAFDPLDPSIVFTINGRNLFKSTNRGGSWSRVQAPSLDILKVHFSPHNSNPLFIATSKNLFKSDDRGQSWQALSDLPSQAGIIDFAFRSDSPNTIYILSGNGFLISSDEGRTWQSRNVGLPSNGLIFDLAVDQKNGEIVYLALDRSVFKTLNGGSSWSRIATLDFYNAPYLYDIVIHPKNSSVLYAAVGGASGHIVNSSDGGKTWQLQSEFTRAVLVSIDPNQPDFLYAAGDRVLRSQDGGATWETLPIPPRYQFFIDALEVHPILPGVVFVGDRANGIFKTGNGGNTWSVVNRGLNSTSIGEIEAAGQDRILAIGRDSFQLYHKRTSQPMWTLLKSMTTKRIDHVAVHPRNPKLIAVAGDFTDGDYESGSNVAVSNDGGVSWRFSRALAGAASGNEILQFHSSNQNILFLSVFNTHGAYAGVARSIDQGRTWKLSNEGLTDPRVVEMAVSQEPGSPVFVVTSRTGQMFRSENAAVSWQRVNLSLQVGEYFGDVQSAAKALYALTALTATSELQSNLYFSSDRGRSWLKRPMLPRDGQLRLSELAMNLKNPTILFAFNPFGKSLFKSTDSGHTWIRFPRPQVNVYDFLFDPLDSKQYFVATSAGVYSYIESELNSPR